MTTVGVETIEQFLYYEAELLDDWRLDEWLELCTDDVVYWVPVGPTVETQDVRAHVSIAYDDRTRLGERIRRIQSGNAHGQDPLSRTCRSVTNVRTHRTDSDLVVVRSVLGLADWRLGRRNTWHGIVWHTLQVGQTSWSIKEKKVLLIDSTDFREALPYIV